MIQAALPKESPSDDFASGDIEPFIHQEELMARTCELAEAIAEDYRGFGVSEENPLHLIGVLKGVVPFMSDLMRSIPLDVPVSVDFLAIAPYGPEARGGGGAARVIKDLDDPMCLA
jgi:hypoxanthine-guanine phosphoribosyltransferase